MSLDVGLVCLDHDPELDDKGQPHRNADSPDDKMQHGWSTLEAAWAARWSLQDVREITNADFNSEGAGWAWWLLKHRCCRVALVTEYHDPPKEFEALPAQTTDGFIAEVARHLRAGGAHEGLIDRVVAVIRAK